ncbi:hypothetical protein SFC42_21555 [Priestia filamentosa]|uniref:hypothetical protein n=1 Tax=Priestia filamentosa TaxID=1402861 RepID=UPI003983B2D9
MSLYESKFLINNSEEMLGIITDFYLQSLEQKEISIVLKLKIKHFLEDIKSSLDYAAFSVYRKYCSQYITAKPENHERGVCFPVHFSEKKFTTFMKNIFPNLESNKPEIFELIRELQPFYSSKEWYLTFNSLVNKNKHRYLTPQTREEETVIRTFDQHGNTHSMFTHGGITIVNSENIKFDDMDWDQEKQLPIPTLNRGYESTTWISFTFTELGKEVLPTLKEIQEQATNVIHNLDASF